jgi:transcriptional regulator with XRE-family HTH domain
MLVLLKLALLRRGERQYELASRLGIGETRLSRIVRGRVEATPEERARIAEALGVPERELFPVAA